MNRLTKLGLWLSLVTLLTFLMPLSASAQMGQLRAYSESSGTICDLTDPGGILNVYVFHELSFGGAIASRFRLATPASWLFLEFQTNLVYVGIPTSDVSVSYGSCITTKTYLGAALYFSGAPAAACSQVRFLPPEGFPQMLAADCSNNEVPLLSGYGVVVNPDQYCCCYCVATESCTWGSVKALYR